MNDDPTEGSGLDSARSSRESAGAAPHHATAAERALAEAEQRRRMRNGFEPPRPREINGRQGPEPVRYGDWENKGIASDF